MDIDTALLCDYIKGFNSIYVETREEHLKAVELLRDIGFKIGYTPSRFSDYHYISLGSTSKTRIHSGCNTAIYPENEVVKFKDLSERFPGNGTSFETATRDELTALLQMA